MFAVAGSLRRLHFFEPLELLIGGRIGRLKSGTVFPSAGGAFSSFLQGKSLLSRSYEPVNHEQDDLHTGGG